MIKRIAFLSAILLSSIAAIAADLIPVKVVGVADGDTITVVSDGVQNKIRLFGIDAPEKAQPFGQSAADTLKNMTAGRSISIQPIEKDRYGRTVAMVYANGACLNEALVSSGNAWVYQQYCKSSICAKWSQLQAKAQSAKAGLWQESGAIAPWEWRHSGKLFQPKTITSQGESAGNMETPSKISFGSFVGNVQTRKFHSSGCRHAGCKNCTATFSTREQAVSAGYVPCQICNP